MIDTCTSYLLCLGGYSCMILHTVCLCLVGLAVDSWVGDPEIEADEIRETSQTGHKGRLVLCSQKPTFSVTTKEFFF